jgi:hypothetical protein
MFGLVFNFVFTVNGTVLTMFFKIDSSLIKTNLILYEKWNTISRCNLAGIYYLKVAQKQLKELKFISNPPIYQYICGWTRKCSPFPGISFWRCAGVDNLSNQTGWLNAIEHRQNA